nr:4'-phosphopantetheinyl transferase superfamily protein [uncultured Clostridium sp.]
MRTIKVNSHKYDQNMIICQETKKANIDKNILSEKERIYYDNLKYEKRKTEFLLGRFVAKRAIGELIQYSSLKEIEIVHGIFGQPIVKLNNSLNIHISISHSMNSAAAIASFEEYPCAIDVERVQNSNSQIIQTILCKEELFLLNDKKDNDEIITILWTAKEAMSKVIQTGFLTDMELFKIKSINSSKKYYIGEFKYFTQYQFISRKVLNDVYTVVCPKEKF